MIDWNKFNNTYQYFNINIVIEIIDLFTKEYDDRMAQLRKNVIQKEFADISFNAHGIKGVIANFMDDDCVKLASQLEEMGSQRKDDGIAETFEKLVLETQILKNELTKYRKQI